MCLDIRHTNGGWPFFTADHASGYKNSPVDPTDAQYCIAALRAPKDNRRYGFLPRALLFGAVSAVLHYNCSQRIISVLANKLFGFPVVNYFDDYGCPRPAEISEEGVDVCAASPDLVCNWM